MIIITIVETLHTQPRRSNIVILRSLDMEGHVAMQNTLAKKYKKKQNVWLNMM